MSWLMLLVGFAAGVLSGVVGIGGGIILVPALVLFAGMSQHRAQGTSLVALLAPVGALAVYEYYREGNIDFRIALLLALGFLIGGYFGAKGAGYVSDLWLRRIFAIILMGLGARMFFFQ